MIKKILCIMMIVAVVGCLFAGCHRVRDDNCCATEFTSSEETTEEVMTETTTEKLAAKEVDIETMSVQVNGASIKAYGEPLSDFLEKTGFKLTQCYVNGEFVPYSDDYKVGLVTQCVVEDGDKKLELEVTNATEEDEIPFESTTIMSISDEYDGWLDEENFKAVSNGLSVCGLTVGDRVDKQGVCEAIGTSLDDSLSSEYDDAQIYGFSDFSRPYYCVTVEVRYGIISDIRIGPIM